MEIWLHKYLKIVALFIGTIISDPINLDYWLKRFIKDPVNFLN